MQPRLIEPVSDEVTLEVAPPEGVCPSDPNAWTARFYTSATLRSDAHVAYFYACGPPGHGYYQYDILAEAEAFDMLRAYAVDSPEDAPNAAPEALEAIKMHS